MLLRLLEKTVGADEKCECGTEEMSADEKCESEKEEMSWKQGWLSQK